MSRWRSIWLVARREILERGRSRGFILSVFFTTALVVGSFVVPSLLFRDDEVTTVGVVQPGPVGLDVVVTATATQLDQTIELGRYALDREAFLTKARVWIMENRANHGVTNGYCGDARGGLPTLRARA